MLDGGRNGFLYYFPVGSQCVAVCRPIFCISRAIFIGQIEGVAALGKITTPKCEAGIQNQLELLEKLFKTWRYGLGESAQNGPKMGIFGQKKTLSVKNGHFSNKNFDFF